MLPIYKGKINRDKDGVVALSLVDDPANESKFVYFNRDDEKGMSKQDIWVYMDDSLLTSKKNIDFDSGKYKMDEDERVYFNKEKFNTVFDVLNDLSKKKVKLSSDIEKRIVYSLVMSPEDLIYRYDKENDLEYFVYYDVDTVSKMSQKFLKESKHHNSNIEHNDNQMVNDVYVVESWIVDNPEEDKITQFNLDNIQRGSWVVGLKIDNDEIWNDYVKTGKVKGISLEGWFTYELVG